MKRRRLTEKKKSKPSEEEAVINLDTPMGRDMGSPVRSFLCVKSDRNLREIEDKEDCFILDFDLSGKKPVKGSAAADEDLVIIAEKGQVACRDYPHPRHCCAKYMFETTSHQSYCKQCYCFVCDVVAPCPSWTGSSGNHCHAVDNEAWRSLRKLKRKAKK